MSISTYRTLSANNAAQLDAAVLAALPTEQPFGPREVILTPQGYVYSQVVVTGSQFLPGTVQSVVAGSGITVDATDANNPIVKLTAIPGRIYNSGALAIKAGASAVVKTVNTVYGAVGATPFSKAAADMAALSGTVTAAKFNVFFFMVDASGTLSTAMGTEGASFAAVVFPIVPSTKAVIGFVIINPTGTGNFVGGTTALDDATVVPNAVYLNLTDGFKQPVA